MPEIYGTLGPRCSDAETLAAMFDAGMTGVRLNLSHITLHDAAAEIDNLHRAAAKCGVKAQLLIDMQGPELRIGALERPAPRRPGIRCLGDGRHPRPGDGPALSSSRAGSSAGRREASAGGRQYGRRFGERPCQARRRADRPQEHCPAGTQLHPPTLTETGSGKHLPCPRLRRDGRDAALCPGPGRSPDGAESPGSQPAGNIRLFAKVENRRACRIWRS